MAGAESKKRGMERRTAPRLPPTAVPSLKGVKLVAGPEVRLINISRGGALIESESRLSPGANLSLRLVTANSIFLLKGRVLRSKVAALSDGLLRYHAALSFDEEFSVLPGEQPTEAADQAAAASVDADPLAVSPAGSVPEGILSDPSMQDGQEGVYYTLSLVCPEDEIELRKILGANAW